ncbi:hypothetical protein BTVI_71321 [Pitangus sulphuratus]|nr:hypothetical protein BTVI_71321 [Pitangus sulphuratus]
MEIWSMKAKEIALTYIIKQLGIIMVELQLHCHVRETVHYRVVASGSAKQMGSSTKASSVSDCTCPVTRTVDLAVGNKAFEDNNLPKAQIRLCS